MINKKLFVLIGILFLISPLVIQRASFSASPTTASIDSSGSSVGTVVTNSLTITFSTNTPRDLILLQVSMANQSSLISGCVVSTVSDTAPLIWTKLGNASESFNRLEVWYAISTSSSVITNDVVTVTLTGSNKCTMGLVVTGVAGSTLSTPFDDGFVFASGNSVSPSVTIGVIFQNDLIVGFEQHFTTTITANSGFIIYQSNTASGSETLKINGIYQALTNANTNYAVGGTLAVSNHWLIGAVAIQSINQISTSNISSATISIYILLIIVSLFLNFIPFFIGGLGYGGLIIELVSAVFDIYLYISQQESNGEFNIIFTTYPTTIFIPVLLALFSFILFFRLIFRKLG